MENEAVSKNFIEQIIEKDLAEGALLLDHRWDKLLWKLFFGGIGHRSAGKSVRCKNTKAQQYICDTWMEQNIRFQRIPGL